MNTTDTAPTYEAPTGVPVITGRFQVMPPPTLEEYLALDRSIWEYGVRVPVIKDENGDIIDGHYRNEIATRRGITCLYRPAFDLLDAEKIAMAITLNVDRRHLNSEQKRELLAKSIKAQPKLSDSEHARRTGSSDKTATKVRSNLEATSEIPKLDETVGADGKTRPAKKPTGQEGDGQGGDSQGAADAESHTRRCRLTPSPTSSPRLPMGSST